MGKQRQNAVVIVPTYNERENVQVLVKRLKRAGPEGTHLLVVDDGSPDGTGEVVRALAERDPGIHLLERHRKEGLGKAKLAGVRWALERDYAVVVEMDGDLSHDPAVVPSMIGALDDSELVIGSRYVEGGGIPKWSLFRRALSRGGNLYQRVVLGIGVRDATSGFRAYRSSILAQLDLDSVRLEGFGFLIEMVRRVHVAGGRIIEIPIFFAERRAGESKIDVRIVLEALWSVAKWGVRDRLRSFRRPTGQHSPDRAVATRRGETPVRAGSKEGAG